MKLALVHDHLNQIGGAEMVLKSLSSAFPHADIYSLIYDKKKMGQFLKDKKITPSFIQNLPFGVSGFKAYLPLMPSAVESFDLKNYDVVLSTSSAYAKGAITGINTPHICYCFSPTRYLWSDSHEYTAGIAKKRFLPLKLMLPPLITALRTWDFGAAQRVDHFIAISHFIARRIRHYYKRESTVIYPPVEVEKYQISKQKEPYYVMVTRLRPYKKVALAIEAFNELKIPLKIIGDGSKKYIRKLKKKAGPKIEFLGVLSEKAKAETLARAQAFIHPQEEDFGIAAVEAMASGTPVIGYGRGGLLETVVPEKTGVFFEEQTWESLALAVLTFKQMAFDAETIKQHAHTFNVARFQTEIRDFLNRCFL
jgi:glycosyltransferase involved in cell wall biosynthesis